MSYLFLSPPILSLFFSTLQNISPPLLHPLTCTVNLSSPPTPLSHLFPPSFPPLPPLIPPLPSVHPFSLLLWPLIPGGQDRPPSFFLLRYRHEFLYGNRQAESRPVAMGAADEGARSVV
jgi:hypothetical protein